MNELSEQTKEYVDKIDKALNDLDKNPEDLSYDKSNIKNKHDDIITVISTLSKDTQSLNNAQEAHSEKPTNQIKSSATKTIEKVKDPTKQNDVKGFTMDTLNNVEQIKNNLTNKIGEQIKNREQNNAKNRNNDSLEQLTQEAIKKDQETRNKKNAMGEMLDEQAVEQYKDNKDQKKQSNTVNPNNTIEIEKGGSGNVKILRSIHGLNAAVNKVEMPIELKTQLKKEIQDISDHTKIVKDINATSNSVRDSKDPQHQVQFLYDVDKMEKYIDNKINKDDNLKNLLQKADTYLTKDSTTFTEVVSNITKDMQEVMNKNNNSIQDIRDGISERETNTSPTLSKKEIHIDSSTRKDIDTSINSAMAAQVLDVKSITKQTDQEKAQSSFASKVVEKQKENNSPDQIGR